MAGAVAMLPGKVGATNGLCVTVSAIHTAGGTQGAVSGNLLMLQGTVSATNALKVKVV